MVSLIEVGCKCKLNNNHWLKTSQVKSNLICITQYHTILPLRASQSLQQSTQLSAVCRRWSSDQILQKLSHGFLIFGSFVSHCEIQMPPNRRWGQILVSLSCMKSNLCAHWNLVTFDLKQAVVGQTYTSVGWADTPYTEVIVFTAVGPGSIPLSGPLLHVLPPLSVCPISHCRNVFVRARYYTTFVCICIIHCTVYIMH